MAPQSPSTLIQTWKAKSRKNAALFSKKTSERIEREKDIELSTYRAATDPAEEITIDPTYESDTEGGFLDRRDSSVTFEFDVAHESQQTGTRPKQRPRTESNVSDYDRPKVPKPIPNAPPVPGKTQIHKKD